MVDSDVNDNAVIGGNDAEDDNEDDIEDERYPSFNSSEPLCLWRIASH